MSSIYRAMSNPEYLQSLSFNNAYWPPLKASDLLAGDDPEIQSEQASIATDIKADVVLARQSQLYYGYGTLILL
jgi:hypothetical protein